MHEKVIMDSGPLVAFLDRSEEHHAWAADQFRQLVVPLLTCEPVLTECVFLLRQTPVAQDKLMELIERRLLVVEFRLQDEIVSIRRLMTKYRDVPMSLADACLVRMAETTDLSICTLDAHFAIYRKHGRGTLPVISPEA